MLAVVLALLDSPLVWFGLLVLSLTTAGALIVVVVGNRKPTPIQPKPDFDSPAARRFHGDNSIGR